jgi:hypothetical protein
MPSPILTNNSKGYTAERSPRNVPPASNSEANTTTQRQEETQTPYLASATVGNSYYADKDLSWWLQLARDFKRARLVPLPDERDDDL